MGISLQQYRATIGKWHAGRIIITIAQYCPTEQKHKKICKNICNERDQKRQIKGPWKLYALTLYAVILFGLALVSITTNSNSSMKNATNMLCLIPNTPSTNLPDHAVANGGQIPLQCHKALLVMAGVEPNPGPVAGLELMDEWIKKQEDIIAGLCAEATDSEVRDCLKLYNPKNSNSKHKTELNKCPKPTITKTLEFLAITGQDQYNKITCINSLICRIQNLLPDNCNLCEGEYCVKRDEISLISCEICGQGSHNACVFAKLGISTPDQADFDQNKIMEKLNPIGLPGLHYLCGACEYSSIPDKNAGLLKRRTNDGTDPDGESSSSTQPSEESQQESITEGSTRPEAESETTNNQQNQPQNRLPEQDVQQTSAEAGTSSSENQASTIKTVCSFYRGGTCKYGSSGRGCPKDHPKPCKKLLQHGNKTPNGCTLGRARCEKFHPKMCNASLTKGLCYETNCNLRHVAGTRKNKPEDNNEGLGRYKKDTRNTKPKQMENRSGDSRSFLDVIQQLKVDMMEAMDTKIAQYISTQPPGSTTGNHIRTATLRINMADPSPYMIQGLQGPYHPMPMQTGLTWGMTNPGQPVYIQNGLNSPVSPMYMPLRQGGWGI